MAAPEPIGCHMSMRRAQSGFTLIEVLITFVILVVGLLGLIGLQARGQQAELESYQRGQALVLLQDMVDRINANRLGAKNQAYVTSAPVGGGGALTDCSTATTQAAVDLCDWGNELNGAAEVAQGGACTTASGANCVGAMLGARGCISYDAASELKDALGATIAGTGVQTISVAWQGVSPTVAPPSSLTCGQGSYPTEAQRRVVTATVRVASLTSK
jgi:type IV pilus assembly protein PilV